MRTPANNAWTTELCECCEEPSGCGFCFYAWCCSCCAYGSNAELMEPVVCCGGECYPACLAYAGMVYIGCPCILQTMTRGYIRNKYGIPGSTCGDFMIAWCCSACSMCQERRELLIRGHGKGGVVNGVQQPPQQQQMFTVQVPMPGYPAPQPGYTAPHPGYTAPQPGYTAPEPGYAAPQPGYAAPQPGYAAPQPGYAAPQPSYAAPEPGFAAPQPSYTAPQPGYPPQAPPQGYYPTVPSEGAGQGKAV
ncbi:hypothetical protein PLESTB_001042900 [Pleodorina starrii]|uniref:PLAC8 family protein n=1 Tax=Pleodorina starrii TaxID=330485 RepID=A0A9W6BPV5_9CHLO|nr:hypothetical protein PLESTB_001042900 [Pleodorina starrii]